MKKLPFWQVTGIFVGIILPFIMKIDWIIFIASFSITFGLMALIDIAKKEKNE